MNTRNWKEKKNTEQESMIQSEENLVCINLILNVKLEIDIYSYACKVFKELDCINKIRIDFWVY